MRYVVKQFKSLAVALKELAPFVRAGQPLDSGRPFANFGDMLPREALANWLLCVAISGADNKDLTFSTDPIGGDGLIIDRASGEVFPTEHVAVSSRAASSDDADALILESIEQKRAMGGAQYASGKTLVVFLNAPTTPWYPNRVARRLPAPLHFASVWVVALQGVEDGQYVYAVTSLDACKGNAPAMIVRINADFTEWTVERSQ